MTRPERKEALVDELWDSAAHTLKMALSLKPGVKLPRNISTAVHVALAVVGLDGRIKSVEPEKEDRGFRIVVVDAGRVSAAENERLEEAECQATEISQEPAEAEPAAPVKRRWRSM